MEINIRFEDEDSFRFIFKNYFIFTDFSNKFEIIDFLDNGYFV